jgi:hypothetical protein
MALVCASPQAVASHDKERWLSLWADNHVIEDPVGSRPVLGGLYDRRSGQRGNAPLARFWDTFIAANQIVFDVHADYVDGLRVVRDVTILTTLPSGVTARTPAHLLYELNWADGQLRIRRMAAHWEVAPVFAQLVRPTAAHVRAMAGSNARLLRHLGPWGALRFVGSVRSVGAAGKRAVHEVLVRAAGGDPAARSLTGPAVPNALTKVIAAGDTVTANCVVGERPGVLIATVNRQTKRVLRMQIFSEQAAGEDR